jgi:hypothetical protein
MESITFNFIGRSTEECTRPNNHLNLGYMDIHRKTGISEKFAGIPFVRKDTRVFDDAVKNMDLIRRFYDCGEGLADISDFDTEERIVLKIEVPQELFVYDNYTDKPVVWHMYSLKRHDADKIPCPDGRKPYEAVDLEEAGISQAYIESLIRIKRR